MNLKLFKATNFRSLVDTGWIKIHDLTAFIGENDSGKSACIDAIKILFEKNSRPDLDDFARIIDSVNEETTVHEIIILEAVLELSDLEFSEISREIPLYANQIHYKKVVNIAESVVKLLYVGQVSQVEDFSGNWRLLNLQPLKELVEKHSIPTTKAKKDELIEEINLWVQRQPKMEGDLDLPTSVFMRFPRVEVFSTKTGAEPELIINRVLKSICDAEIKSEKYQGKVTDIQDGIVNSLKEKISELLPFIKKYYSEVENVTIEPQLNFSSGLSNTPLLLSNNSGSPITLLKKGEGKKRQVALGIYEWGSTVFKSQNDMNAVLILDEPDTHMDYMSQRKLFDIISGYVSPSMQVIIATHSLNLINRMPVGKINHFCRNAKRLTEVENLSADDPETESMFLHDIGVSIGLDSGVIFHERCFLIVEGPTEMNALPKIFQTLFGFSLQTAGIKLINGDNNIGARNFAKFLNSNNRSVIFILDNDCRKITGRKAFSEEILIRDGFDIENQVFFVGEEEFEDAFSDDFLAKIANCFYQETSKKSWNSEEIALLRQREEKFSTLLQREFGNSKPDIGYKIGLSLSNKDEIPEVICAALQKALAVANAPKKSKSSNPN
jgi:putative ATP-dependent endonuclease of the OLD family